MQGKIEIKAEKRERERRVHKSLDPTLYLLSGWSWAEVVRKKAKEE